MPSEPLFLPDTRDVCQLRTAGGWVPVELTGTGTPMPRGDVWVCSPTEFGRRYRAGTARLVEHRGLVVDPDALAAEAGDVDGLGFVLTLLQTGDHA